MRYSQRPHVLPYSDAGGNLGDNSIEGGAGSLSSGDNLPDDCDLCFIKNLRMQASSPYYDGPLLVERSIYESKTSSCAISGYPLTMRDLPFYTWVKHSSIKTSLRYAMANAQQTRPTQPSETRPTTCSGKLYQIQPGDDCHSISKSQGISNGWLITDNALTANCADFPTDGTLCLVNTCEVYTVGQNETCVFIAGTHNITEAQFKAWNPVGSPDLISRSPLTSGQEINAGCYNLARMNGSEVCVGVPGKAYTYPPPMTLAPTIPLAAAPVPTDAAQGTNTKCGRWYRAVLGEYCNEIVIKFGIAMDDFVFLNTAINQNCTNLLADESYCIQAVGDSKFVVKSDLRLPAYRLAVVNTYAGRPGQQSITLTSFIPVTKFSDLPDATYTSIPQTSTALPLATDTRGDCFMYFDGESFQEDLSGTNWNSPCEIAAAVFNVQLEDLEMWNPGTSSIMPT